MKVEREDLGTEGRLDVHSLEVGQTYLMTNATDGQPIAEARQPLMLMTRGSSNTGMVLVNLTNDYSMPINDVAPKARFRPVNVKLAVKV